MKEHINDYLIKYSKSDNYPWHMPGHKRQNVFETDEMWQEIFSRDFTEAKDLDDMHEPETFIRDAMQTFKEIYGTYSTYMLVNGSTGGILSALYACAPEKSVVLVARNCHKSVYNAICLLKLRPEYIMPEMIPDTSSAIFGDIKPQQVEEKIIALRKKGIKPSTAVITSPTYEGVISDVAEILAVLKKYDIPLIVDEAHGAHLPFMGEDYPVSAINAGADIVVQSTHKTLPALTQTALLHVNNEKLDENIKKYLKIFQTSSPSYIFMQSIEKAVFFSYTHKEEYLKYRQILESFRAKCLKLKNICLLDTENKCYAYDICKLVFMINSYEKQNEKEAVQNTEADTGKQKNQYMKQYTGTWLAERLAAYHKITEMAGTNYVIAMTSVADKEEAYDALFDALEKIDEEIETITDTTNDIPKIKTIEPSDITIPEMAIIPGEAWNLPTERTELKKAVNCISGTTVYAYPPGIPLLVPGEKISESTIRAITKMSKSDLNLSGVYVDDGMLYIDVVICKI